MSARIVESAVAESRIECALDWLTSRGRSEEVLVIGPSGDAVNELVRNAAMRRGAAFGWHRMTLGRLCATLATPAVVEQALAPIGPLATEAVVARVVHALRGAEAELSPRLARRREGALDGSLESALESGLESAPESAPESGRPDTTLGRYAPVANSPGFPRALSRTVAELRLARISPELLNERTPELARLCEAVASELECARLADRSVMLRLASAAARDPQTPAPAALLLGLPILWFDLPLRNAAESELVAALAARSPDVLVSVAAGDTRSRLFFEQSLAPTEVEVLTPEAPPYSLARLQRDLFSEDSVSVSNDSDDVDDPGDSERSQVAGLAVLSAPGESRECVEIVRRIAAHAAQGVAFDQMAVLLRSPDEYRPHLQEAFRRADIPAHFARGLVQPDPTGRAFLALLASAAEGLSARRFAEYLSLGEMPDATEQGAPPEAAAPDERWVAPDDESVSERVAHAGGPNPTELATELATEIAAEIAAEVESGTERVGETEGDSAIASVRAPRRWERLLVEAAVIGGRDRWERRLAGLREETLLEIRLEIREHGDSDDATVEALRSRLDDLEALRAFALPLLSVLDGFPGGSMNPTDAANPANPANPTNPTNASNAADSENPPDSSTTSGTSHEWSWGRWLDELAGLATSSLRHPERVLSVLAELAPMAPIGPVSLAEVRHVLAPRLLEISLPPSASRYGSVYVAPVEAARGLCFDVVFVPGLAERLFPRKISQEPILLDDARAHLAESARSTRQAQSTPQADAQAAGSHVAPTAPSSSSLAPLSLGLVTNLDRVAEERLALRLAVGAARPSGQLVLSYPRLDLDQGRPRVPSFYALEVVRAAEGVLPGFAGLARRAESLGAARVGWPAPDSPDDAIDEAEHDLALLDSLLRLDPDRSVGTARYLVTTNPHLGRALRFRARRWLPRWTVADGLVSPSESGMRALAEHALALRSYSPTALQHFSACPYRFLLQAVHRLSPREEPEAIERMNPLQRGSLFHDVLFELQSKLRESELLPIRSDDLEVVRTLLETTLDRVAARYHDELAPAVARVWKDGVDSVRADLLEWLRRESEDDSGFVPWRFELAFGLAGGASGGAARDERDPHSTPEPVQLDSGLRLRGSVDLVERGPGGVLRATDYKTGRVRVKQRSVVEGGASLQPVFYALALEKLFPDESVQSGQLYYCTAAGGYAKRETPLDAEARRCAAIVTDAVGQALHDGFLPAAPKKDACRFCDYNVVCGPYEELRSARKPRRELEGLERVRRLP